MFSRLRVSGFSFLGFSCVLNLTLMAFLDFWFLGLGCLRWGFYGSEFQGLVSLRSMQNAISLSQFGFHRGWRSGSTGGEFKNSSQKEFVPVCPRCKSIFPCHRFPPRDVFGTPDLGKLDLFITPIRLHIRYITPTYISPTETPRHPTCPDLRKCCPCQH